MARPTMTRVTTLLLLLLLAETTTVAIASKADVNIFNEVGIETIAVHCRSGDNDLGEKQIGARGVYGWGFKPNWFGSTFFWCRFAWRKRGAVFNVWTDAGAFKLFSLQPVCIASGVSDLMGSTGVNAAQDLLRKFIVGVNSMLALVFGHVNDLHLS